ncbi:unnamed protein product, partial [Rotaria sp. Silwood1]
SSSSIALFCKIVTILIFILLLIEQSPWTYLLYPALVCIHTWISINFTIHWIQQKILSQINYFSFWLNLIIIGIFLQTYILPFFYRWTMSIGVFLLFIDSIRRWQG